MEEKVNTETEDSKETIRELQLQLEVAQSQIAQLEEHTIKLASELACEKQSTKTISLDNTEESIPISTERKVLENFETYLNLECDNAKSELETAKITLETNNATIQSVLEECSSQGKNNQSTITEINKLLSSIERLTEKLPKSPQSSRKTKSKTKVSVLQYEEKSKKKGKSKHIKKESREDLCDKMKEILYTILRQAEPLPSEKDLELPALKQDYGRRIFTRLFSQYIVNVSIVLKKLLSNY